jgi:hypothetical protein
LNQQPFQHGGSALDHYFGENTQQTLAVLQEAIPELPVGTDESGALRLLLQRGKPSGVSWHELAVVASVAYPEYAALNQESFQRGGSALDHLGEPATLTGQALTTATAYSNRRGATLRELANNRYSPFGPESVGRPTLDGLAALFFDLALNDQLPKSAQGRKRTRPDGTPLVGLAPSSFLTYLSVLGHRLFVPWLLEEEAKRIGRQVTDFAQRPVFVFGPGRTEEGIRLVELLSQVSNHTQTTRGVVVLVGAAAQGWKAREQDKLHPSILGVAADFAAAADLMKKVSPGTIYGIGSERELAGLRVAASEQGLNTVEAIASESLAQTIAAVLRILGGLRIDLPVQDVEEQYGVSIDDLARQLQRLIQIGV